MSAVRMSAVRMSVVRTSVARMWVGLEIQLGGVSE